MTFPRSRQAILAALLATALVAQGCKPRGDEEAAAPPATDVAGAPDRAAPAPDGTAAPEAAPRRELPSRPGLRVDTLDHGTFDLSERRDRWVVVNFWATWCAPCLKEMPELSALDAMHEDIEVIGLAYEDIDVAAMREFLGKHPVVYPVAIVDVYDPPADFEAPRGLPMTYLLRPDGEVAERFLGPVTAADIEKAIAGAGGPAA